MIAMFMTPAFALRPAGRSLHLIDLENLVGDPYADGAVIAAVWKVYRGGVSSTSDDQYIVGSSREFAKRAWFVLPRHGICRRARSGKDGGELSIIESLDLEYLSTRFGRLVIASGDGMFTATATDARTLGMHVHQVVGVGCPSRALAAAAHTHSQLRLGRPMPLVA